MTAKRNSGRRQVLRAKRNDPCPCGSGKKYKHCCMRADQLGASREVNLTSGEAILLTDLYQFAQLPRFSAALFEAFGLYWGGSYDISAAGELGQENLRTMLEWFIHDYPVNSDRQHVIDLFIAERGERYPQEAQTLLAAWAESVPGLWRVLKQLGADRVSLYDQLGDEVAEVYSPLLSHNARVGDLVIGREVKIEETLLMAPMVSLLPTEYEQPLGDYVRNAYRLYCEEHAGASWGAFLRANGHIINAFMLSAQGESLRGLIGAGTRFRDPAEGRDRLRAKTRQLRSEEQRRAREAEEAGPKVRRTASGIILPGAEPETPQAAEGSARQDDEAQPSHILLPGRDF